MKKITQKLILALALSVASMPAFAQLATPTSFAPVLTSEEAPFRFFANLNTSLMFSSFEKDGKFNMYNDQLNLGLIYNAGMGLDVGFGVHGGIFSPYGIGRDLPAGKTDPYKQLGPMFGLDIMVRYLAMFSDMFYGGLQAQVGYNYTDLLPGAPDSHYTGQDLKKGEANSFIPVVLGLALGADFAGAASVYMMPALELGQTPKDTDKGGIWKSALGFQIAVGTAIDLGGTKLVIEAKPRMANLDDKYSWGMDATLGAFWDF